MSRNVIKLQISNFHHRHEQQSVATGGAFLLGIPLAGILASKVRPAHYVCVYCCLEK